ncbi:MAG TPA: TadE/TadG family type IV pilus assembly protein [Candidatus Binatia bacterium]|nr:TadE/TadG family type IV pilus assembly protein [Candidatus Binatia bacterium]
MSESRRTRDQRGTSTLEFVVVLPTLLLIFLGGLEFSRAWFTANVVTSAAREGARVAVVTPATGPNPTTSPVFDPGPAVARIGAVLSAANLTPTAVSVTCTPAPPPPGQSGCVPGSQITATVTVNFATVVPAFLPMLASRPITGTATMRRE